MAYCIRLMHDFSSEWSEYIYTTVYYTFIRTVQVFILLYATSLDDYSASVHPLSREIFLAD